MRTLRSAALLMSAALVPAAAGAQAAPRLQGDAWRAAGGVANGAAGICGKGAYEFRIGGARVGSESFETTCAADGRSYASSAHTTFSVAGTTMELETTLEVGRDWLPTRFTAKGQAGGTQLEQTLQLADGMATVTANGQSQQLPYTRGAAFISQNIYHVLPFVVARYDLAEGGVQRIAVFPKAEITLELQGTDTVRPERAAGGASAPGGPAALPARFTRYYLGAGPGSATIWFDAAGRMAVVAAPAQQFVGAREEFAEYAQPLVAALARTTAATAPAAEPVPDYSAPAGATFTATDVTIPVADYQLAGTLLMPRGAAGKVPAVIMITGSGQQTRDERIALPGLARYRPFRQIAETLAARGVAVLRVDDRGAGASTGQQRYASATTADLAGDTRAQVAWLRARPEVDAGRIALVGHSEGATIATLVAADDPRVAAVVMLAGAGKRGDSVLVDQLDDLLARDTTLTAEQRAAQRARQQEMFGTLRAGGEIPGDTRTVWMRAFVDFDPLPTVRRVRQPLLVLQGALDRQVTAPQAALLADAARAAGNRDVTVKVFPSLNHLFLPAKTGAFSEYNTLATTSLPPDVLGTIADWLAVRLKTGR